MPRYIKDGHVIFASNRAYKALYEEQGYLPLKEENAKEAKENQSMVSFQDNVDDMEDDYSDDEETVSKVDLDPNDAMPLAARVAMLTYDELKVKAKELGIPKYANTKRDELVTLIADRLEKSNA